MPPSGGFRSATTTVAPSAARPSAIAAPIPCAPPVTIATLPSSAHFSGENAVGIRIRFSWVWISGWIFARKAFHVSSAWSSARRRARSVVVVVGPQVRVGGELPDVGRERADQPPEVALLELDPLGLVQADQLVQLARVDVVVALLDDHPAIL